MTSYCLDALERLERGLDTTFATLIGYGNRVTELLKWRRMGIEPNECVQRTSSSVRRFILSQSTLDGKEKGNESTLIQAEPQTQ